MQAKRASEYRDTQQAKAEAEAEAREQPQNVAKQPSDINSYVQSAVNSVNKAVELNASKKKPRRNIQVDESLDSLDFFKVTNLGRFNNQDNASSTKQASRKKQFEHAFASETNNASRLGQAKQPQPQASAQRAKWGTKSDAIQSQGSVDKSQYSVSKESAKKMHGHGPVMVKNPFPDDFAFASPAQSSMSRRSNKNEKEEKDILDEFVVGDKLKQQAPAWKSKRQTINEMEAVSTQQEAFKASVEESVPKQQPNMERTAQAAIPSMIDEPQYIPTLPAGKRLNFNVLETWGDMNYLGLTGIEIFDQNGSQL